MITTELRVITGLHIGGSDDTMQIGGIDNAVVKRVIYSNPDGSNNYNGTGKKITEPYIPGSSLKGKVRSLLEHRLGLIQAQKIMYQNISNQKNKVAKQGKPIDTEFINKCQNKLLQEKAKLIVILFGESAGSGDIQNTKITRAIFRDSFLTKITRKLYLDGKISFSEVKAENTINRVTVEANPRFLERVPAGVEFDFEIVLRKFEEDKHLPLMKTLELGLKLLENDALGGGGSRGNGKIEFKIYQTSNRNIQTEIEELIKEIETLLEETKESL